MKTLYYCVNKLRKMERKTVTNSENIGETKQRETVDKTV